MILAFTGTQDGMTAAQKEAVKGLIIALAPDKVLHGGCVGADEDFDALAGDFALKKEILPSNVKGKQGACLPGGVVHLPAPPLKRNDAMAKRADVLIATPKEFQEQLRSGTWATVRYARAHKKSIYIVWPDGNIKIEENKR